MDTHASLLSCDFKLFVVQYHTTLMGLQSEKQDMQTEHNREMEALLDNVRQLSHEVKRLSLIMEYFIPEDFLHMIVEHTHWNEDIGEWQLVLYFVANHKNITLLYLLRLKS